MTPEPLPGGQAEEQEKVLFFRSGGELFAIEVTSLEEVVVVEEWTPVPLAPEGVVGIVNQRGRIFTVVEFSRLAGLGTAPPGCQAVFLHRPDMSVGFTVAGIEGVGWVPRRLIGAQEGPSGEGRPAFLRGLLDFEGRVAGVIDAGKLAETIARLPEGAQH